MPTRLQIAHGGYAVGGESIDEPSHKEKARFSPPFISAFLCVY